MVGQIILVLSSAGDTEHRLRSISPPRYYMSLDSGANLGFFCLFLVFMTKFVEKTVVPKGV